MNYESWLYRKEKYYHTKHNFLIYLRDIEGINKILGFIFYKHYYKKYGIKSH